MTKLLTIAALIAAFVLAGCGGDDGDDGGEDGSAAEATTEAAEAPEAEPEPKPKPSAPGTKIKLSGSDFGQILFTGDDGAIYLFDKEKTSKSECYGECAVAWPPVLTKGEPQAGPGVKQGLLGTTKRNDGTTQVTYNGHPLYLYKDDPPGVVLCHNVEEFGGLWLVVDAAGDAV